ncbi:MAG: hypothetical protein WCP32_10285 [Bacteroidota bacterium]
MTIKITIEKLSIEYIDTDSDPVEETKPVVSEKRGYATRKKASNKIAPGAKKMVPNANKVASDAKQVLRLYTPDEARARKAISNTKWRLKKTKELTPEKEAELNAVLAEIEENRRKPYEFSTLKPKV